MAATILNSIAIMILSIAVIIQARSIRNLGKQVDYLQEQMNESKD